MTLDLAIATPMPAPWSLVAVETGQVTRAVPNGPGRTAPLYEMVGAARQRLDVGLKTPMPRLLRGRRRAFSSRFPR